MRQVVFLVLICLISCKRSDKIELSYFGLEDFPETKCCKSDSIGIQVLDALSYHVLRDSLVLVTTRGHNGYFVEMYYLGSKQKVMNFAKKGLDTNQFAHARVFLNDKNTSTEFYLYNVITNSIVEINIDSLLENRETFNYKKVYLSGYSSVPDFCKYDKGRYLVQNKYFSPVKNFNNNVDRFIFVNEKEFNVTNSTYSDFKKYNYYLSNINQVVMFSDVTKNRLWCASKGEDRFDIYTRDSLRLLGSYIGPYHYDVEYVVGEAGGDLPLVVRDGLYSGYEAAVITDNYVYLLLGNQKYKSEIPKSDVISDKSEIYKLSWEGKLLCRYILDRYVYRHFFLL